MPKHRAERWDSFPAALRGYRTDQVDRYLDQLEQAVADGRPTPVPPALDTTLRGYRRDRVDAYVWQLLSGGRY